MLSGAALFEDDRVARIVHRAPGLQELVELGGCQPGKERQPCDERWV
jgi:hypothetical protein